VFIGSYRVKTTSERTSPDYTLREFFVTKEGEKEEGRKIFHFHFQVSPEETLVGLHEKGFPFIWLQG